MSGYGQRLIERAHTTERARAMFATEACKLGKHGLCDGTGTLIDGTTTATCKCPCHHRGISVIPTAEPDEWRDAEDERYSDEAHEPKERT